MAVGQHSTFSALPRPHRAYEIPKGPPLAHKRPLRRLRCAGPVSYSFPPDDHDWAQANLPVLRAAIGILGQDSTDLLATQREATAADPTYARRMVGDLNQRIAHFETLARILRLARERVETIAPYVATVEA